MSYCVNCGVELEEVAEKCPLCDTPVINPNKKENSAVSASYSDKPADIPESSKKRYKAFIITIAMLIPNIVCFLSNIIFNYGYMWIWILNATSVLIWTFVVLPLILNKKSFIFQMLINTVVSVGYAFVLYYLEQEKGLIVNHGHGWFVECAVPIILVGAVLTVIVGLIIKHRKPHWSFVCISVLGAVAIGSISFDLTITHYLKNSFTPAVSLIIASCCAALMIFFASVAGNSKMKAWLDKKFYVD